MKRYSVIFGLLAGSAISVLSPTLAHADNSCNLPIWRHVVWDQSPGPREIRYQRFQYVYVKDNGSWTAWGVGRVTSNNNNQLVDDNGSGGMNLLFSDRKFYPQGSFTGQPFNLGQPDNIVINSIDVHGNITIHNKTWNADGTFSAQCSDNTMIAHTPDGTLVVTLTDASDINPP
jgi:hypothetical protein